MTFDTNEFYLKSSEEMAESFADMPGGARLDARDRRALRRRRSSSARQLIPRFDARTARPSSEYLRALVEEGLRERYGDPPPAEARRAHGDGARASSTRWASTPTS